MANILDDKYLKTMLAAQYGVEEDSKLLVKMHTLGSLETIYRAKEKDFDYLKWYYRELKELISLDEYKNIPSPNRRRFEKRICDIISGLTAKVLGFEYIPIRVTCF